MFLFFPDNINNNKKNSVWTSVWTALKFNMDTITYFPCTLVGFVSFFKQISCYGPMDKAPAYGAGDSGFESQ